MRPLWKGCEGGWTRTRRVGSRKGENGGKSRPGRAELDPFSTTGGLPARLLAVPPTRFAGQGGVNSDMEREKKWQMAKPQHPAHPIASLPLQRPVLCRPAACFGLKKCPFLPSIVSISFSRFRPCPPLPSRPPGLHRIFVSTRRKNKKTDSSFASNIQSITLRRAPATNRRLLRPSICCSFAPLRITATAITVGDSSLCARVLCSTPLPGARVHRRTARQRPATRCCCLLLHAARLCHQPASLTGSTVPFPTPNATTTSLRRQTAKQRQDEGPWEKSTTENPHPSQGSPLRLRPKRSPVDRQAGGRATTTIQNLECGLVTSTTGRPSPNYPVPRPIDY